MSRWIASMAVLVLAVGVVAGQVRAAEEAEAEKPENLLENGDMEKVDDEGALVGWNQPSVNEGGEASIAPTEEDPKDGERALRMTSEGFVEWASASSSQVSIEEGKTYTLAGHARVRNGQAMLQLIYFKDGEYIGHHDSNPAFGGDWREITMRSQLAQHPDADTIAAGVLGTGDVDADFDELVLTAE